jgi:hypothetical protein
MIAKIRQRTRVGAVLAAAEWLSVPSIDIGVLLF